MVAHTFDPSTWEAEGDGSLDFKANLVYRVSSRTAMATQRNPVSKNPKREREIRGSSSQRTLTSRAARNGRASPGGAMGKGNCEPMQATSRGLGP